MARFPKNRNLYQGCVPMTNCFAEKDKRWLAITVPAIDFYEDVVASFLVELTGSGVEFSPQGITAYLPMDENLTPKLGALDTFLRKLMGDNKDQQTIQWYGKVVYEEDWSESWKAYFKPLKIGEKIVVSPSWEKYVPAKNEILISIDPGRAFGVGTHPTTSMCVRAIERIAEKMSKDSKESWNFCDVGCGTGILAIVAAKLGAEKVLAVDIDPVAVQVARANCEKNAVMDKVEILKGSVDKINGKYSCIAANLTSKLLLNLAPSFKNILQPGGRLILSGMLDSEVDQIDRVFLKLGYRILDKLSENEWGLLVYSNKHS